MDLKTFGAVVVAAFVVVASNYASAAGPQSVDIRNVDRLVASTTFDVYKDVERKIPHTSKVCRDVEVSDSQVPNVIIGGVLGSVIGNAITDGSGAGTIGAIIGADIARKNHDRNTRIETRCHNVTEYTTQIESVYDYSIIEFIDPQTNKRLQLKYNR